MDADEELTRLMTDSGDRLLRLAFQLTHDRAAAEDVVREAPTRIWTSWRRHEPGFDDDVVERAGLPTPEGTC